MTFLVALFEVVAKRIVTGMFYTMEWVDIKKLSFLFTGWVNQIWIIFRKKSRGSIQVTVETVRISWWFLSTMRVSLYRNTPTPPLISLDIPWYLRLTGVSSFLSDTNSVLSKLMFNACVMPAHMPEKMLMEHALLIAILHANVGNEVGKIFLYNLSLTVLLNLNMRFLIL